MDLKIHFFDDCNPRFWNINISNLDRNHHFITWEVLKYYSAFNGIKNLSFLVEIEKKKLLQQFPWQLTKIKRGLVLDLIMNRVLALQFLKILPLL